MSLILKALKPKNLFRIISNPKLAVIRVFYICKTLYYDFYFLLTKNKIYKHKIIFIAGMPLSASTLLKNMLGKIPYYFTRYTPMPEEVAINKNISDSAFNYCPKNSYTLFKTHLNPFKENIDILDKNNVKKVLVSYRDLRDVALSRYYRILEFPKKANDPRYIDYRVMNKEEGINHSIKVICKHYTQWINGWISYSKDRPGFIHFCKFEDLVDNRKEEFKKMLNFYDIELNDETIDDIIKNTEGKNTVKKNFSDSAILPWRSHQILEKVKLENGKKIFLRRI